MPSTAGLPRDHPRRHRSLRGPAGERQGMPSRRHGKHWNECRAPARHSGRVPLDTYGSRDGRTRPRTEARGGRREHAGAHRAASGASGVDRIVGVMSASGAYDTVPSNRCRGATMGPPACSDQSSPVAFRACCCTCLQGLSSSWDDWRRQKSFLIRKRSQVRVLDRPLAGIQDFAAFVQYSGFWLLKERRGLGAPWGHDGATSFYRHAGKRSWLRAAVRSARAPNTPFAAY